MHSLGQCTACGIETFKHDHQVMMINVTHSSSVFTKGHVLSETCGSKFRSVVFKNTSECQTFLDSFEFNSTFESDDC